jgi:xanthosine utilization system XapX-like protein
MPPMAQPAANGNGKQPSPAMPPPAPPMVTPPALPRRRKAKKILAVEAFEVKAAELEQDDPKTLAEALQIAVGNEWASGETAATRLGFDPMVEKKKIEQERAEGITRYWQGKGGTPPVEGTVPAMADYGQPEEEPAKESEAPAVLEAVAPAPPAPMVLNLIGGKDDEQIIAVGKRVLEHVSQSADETQAQVAALGGQVEGFRQTTAVLAERLESLAAAADRRDGDYRAALGQVMDTMEALSEQAPPPPVIPLDAGTVARIAKQAASEAVAAAEKISTEVLTRDGLQRAATLRVLFANGRVADYRVVRDPDGHMAGLELIGKGD